jgi:hypothetical protein
LHYLPWLASDQNPPTYGSCKAEVTGMNDHTQLYF